MRELQEADRPLSPKELAERYDCGGDHMRGVLADLVDPRVVERPERGKYVISEAYADTDLTVRNAGSGEPEVEAAHGEDDLPGLDELYQRQHDVEPADPTGEDHVVPVETAEESSEDHAETTPGLGGFSLPGGAGIVAATLVFAVIVLVQANGGDAGGSTSTEGVSEQQEQQGEDAGPEVSLIG